MVPCGSSPVTRARLCHAKNEAPEEEAVGPTVFVRILFDFNTFSPYKNGLQAFLFSQGGIFSESWLHKNKTIMS